MGTGAHGRGSHHPPDGAATMNDMVETVHRRQWGSCLVDTLAAALGTVSWCFAAGVPLLMAVQAYMKAARNLVPGRNIALDTAVRVARHAGAVAAGYLMAVRFGEPVGAAAAGCLRLITEGWRPRALTCWRVQVRISRLRELNVHIRRHVVLHPEQKESRENGAYSFTDGEKSAIMKPDSSRGGREYALYQDARHRQ